MALSRRNFLKTSAGAAAVLGVNLFDNPTLRSAFAAAVQETPVVWLASGCCSGCSVSLLNSLAPRIQDILLDQVLPGHHISLNFHPTVMAASFSVIQIGCQSIITGSIESLLLLFEAVTVGLNDVSCRSRFQKLQERLRRRLRLAAG